MPTIEEQKLDADSSTETKKEKTAAELKQEKREKIAAKFSKFKDVEPTALASDKEFLAMATAVFNEEAVSQLPSGKYLKQTFVKGPSNEFYAKCINQIYDDVEFVPAGKGNEFILDNGVPINTLDVTKFVPTDLNDVDNYSYVGTIDLPKEVKEVELTTAPYKYVEYFLSGKVDEYVASVIARADETVDLWQYFNCFNQLKEIFTNIYKKASSTPTAKTNHLVGTKNYIVDAVKEFKDFIFDALSHNTEFCYDPSFGGYNNMKEDDTVYITTKETYNNLIKVAATFLASDKLTEFANMPKWVVLPTQMLDPNISIKNPDGSVKPISERLVPLNIFVDADGKRVEGAIMVIERSGLRRLRNLKNSYSEFYPKNLTTVFWHMIRQSQGILPWTQCAVYNNKALESDLVVPVEQITPPTE